MNLPEVNPDNPNVLSLVRYWISYDARRRQMREVYESQDDAGKAAIDWMLLAICGFKFPTLWRMATEKGFPWTEEENDAQKAAGKRLDATREIMDGDPFERLAAELCGTFNPTEYAAEMERRRQIGLSIDPAIAETMFWWADINDPYCILDAERHEGQVGRERFARNPGGEWVDFNDLPEATRKALWARDERKLMFPYGLHGEDMINRPPAQ